MAKGIALAMGLNAVDPKHYGGWPGELTACEADAEDMTAIGKAHGFKVTTLLTKAATRAKAKTVIGEAAKSLKSGDIFLLSYSGHGGQVPDKNGDEPDAQDETWCLYDGQLIDDELYSLFRKFAAGVRVLVFSDSCHSGTVTKMAYYSARAHSQGGAAVKYRNMPAEIALRTYRSNKKFYDSLQADKEVKGSRRKVNASVLLFSGCQDSQLSQDGNFNGLFTANLLAVWKDGDFKGDYRAFHKAILRRMPPDQTPNYLWGGKKKIAGAGHPPRLPSRVLSFPSREGRRCVDA
jgi:metacaspase-1